MVDPERDHGFVPDYQGDIDVIRSPFFDVGFGFDHTVEDYLNRILPHLVDVLDEQLPTDEWTITGSPPTSPTSAPSPATSPLCITCLLIGQEQIEALYQYAKFQFECGNYSGAADYLYHYRDLCTNSDRSLSALWGKLAAEILMQNWAIALEELNRLKEIIDSKNFASPLYQLQNRIWLMHWSLFIFFNHENGRNGIIDLFFQDRYLNAIQTNANHLLRYVATAVIVSKRRWNMIKELIKVIQQENHVFKDPITEFLECLYINYDFEGAQQKLQEYMGSTSKITSSVSLEIEIILLLHNVILNDPFLGKRVEDANFSTVPLKDEFLENARLFIFETYCRIHQCIDIGMLAEKLNMNYDEAENWIMNLVQNAKLEAKIDSVSGTVIMETSNVNVYEQLIETMKNLNTRTYLLAKSLVDQTPQSAR
ncbi:hypothetical protein MA16_Dca001912 [Dendrobium catenatum]|uniref:Eukaryotic translation initiation factor 3 subunit E n=1 Tax=Dendrobium catenatum TaxID=906689 RepID=A0A2I0XDT5_9ASPA|nr:hypothetical protein MA16_Dca001912 [Dendrobium catenatum]